MALGQRYDIVGEWSIVRGLPWRFEFAYLQKLPRQPIDLTGCSSRLIIGDTPAASESVVLTSPGSVTLGGQSGAIAAALDAQTTAAMAFQRPRYWWYLTDAMGVERLFMYGRIGIVEDGE